MKKFLLSIIAIVTLTCIFAFAGCEEPHEHEFGEWKTTKEATCTAEGEAERTCDCGEKETKPIQKIYHTNSNWIIDKEATCDEEGIKHLECTVCKETTVSGPIPATGHTDGEWIVDSEATCTTDGSKHQVCSVCEASIKTEAIAATGHSDGEWITDTEATCTTDGSKHQICSVCNETINTANIPATGHTDGEWIVDAEATCTTDGSKHQVCSICNETIKTETIAAIGHNYKFDSLENNGAIGSNVVYKCSNCNEIKKEIINELSVTVIHTGSSEASLSGWGSFSQYFNAEATGGYGEYQYKFEMYYDSSSSIPVAKLTKDFSSDNTYGVSYRGYRNELNGYVLKVTVTDAAGNTATGIYVFNF